LVGQFLLVVEFHDALRPETEADDGAGEKCGVVNVRVDALAGNVLVDYQLVKLRWGILYM